MERTEREVYLRRVLTGEMACYCPEELAEAAGLFGAGLYVGAGLWVEGWPYVLVKFERAGVGDYGQIGGLKL